MHVVMAVDIKEKATVGCAYYVSEEQKLYLLKDTAMGGAEVLETRKSKRMDVSCLNHLNN